MTPIKQNAESADLPELADGRQSPAAAEIARGTMRLLTRLGFTALPELSLPSWRRADLVALAPSGDIWIIEIKSSLEDFRADQKWPEYRAFCDRLLFAVKPDFPAEVLPADAGLVLADRYGAELVREAPEHRLAAQRRKSLTLRFARAAALRLALANDPTLSQALAGDGH